MSRRTERVNNLLRQEISLLIVEELEDPRLRTLITITFVDVSSNLQHANVGISVMDSKLIAGEALKALESASGFIQNELAQRVRMRNTPKLRFQLDPSIDEGNRILSMLNDIRSNSTEHLE